MAREAFHEGVTPLRSKREVKRGVSRRVEAGEGRAG